MAQKAVPAATPAAATPWRASVGQRCTFYYEGGHGERYWSGGWHYGIIRAIPIKGQKKNWMHIELPTDLWTWDSGQKKPDGSRRKRGWYKREHVRAWVFSGNVNAPGDFLYHGPKLAELVAERRAAKHTPAST